MKREMMGKAMTAAVCMMAMAVTLTACGAAGTESAKSIEAEPVETATVGALLLSVNPEIEIEYDEHGTVLEVEGINDDGKTVAGGYVDYQGKDCVEVVSELVRKIYENGYFETQLDDHTKNIVVKLEDGSLCPDEAFLEQVAEGVRRAVNECGVDSSPVIVEKTDLDDRGYISLEKAQEIVLSQLGLDAADFTRTEYDLEDGIYEMEFTAGGIAYEYEVSAVNGKVLEADYENNDDWNDRDDLDDADDVDDDRDDDHDDRDDADDVNDDRDDDHDDKDDVDDVNDDRDDDHDDRDDADDVNDDRDDDHDDRDDADDVNDDRDDDHDDKDDVDDDHDNDHEESDDTDDSSDNDSDED